MNINTYIRLKDYKHINNGEGFEHVTHAINTLGMLEFKKLVRNFHKDPIIKEIKEAQRLEEIEIKKQQAEVKKQLIAEQRKAGIRTHKPFNHNLTAFKESIPNGFIGTVKEICKQSGRHRDMISRWEREGKIKKIKQQGTKYKIEY